MIIIIIIIILTVIIIPITIVIVAVTVTLKVIMMITTIKIIRQKLYNIDFFFRMISRVLFNKKNMDRKNIKKNLYNQGCI